MSLEIERKFLVRGTPWEQWGAGERYRQGYLGRGEHATARVRLAGSIGQLTVKGRTVGISRPEFEYEIPSEDAEQLLSLCEGALIEKRRWKIPYGSHLWEVDVFEGDNLGLVVAEVELSHPEEPVDFPPWIGAEVSDDARYFNASLSRYPWNRWPENLGEDGSDRS